MWFAFNQRNITISDSSFTQNIAHGVNDTDSISGGGAIYISPVASADTSISNSMVLHNVNFTGNLANGIGGGVVAMSLNQMLVDSCHFVSNEALSYGGGMVMDASCLSSWLHANTGSASTRAQTGADPTPCHAGILNTSFDSNTAFKAGGAYLDLDGYLLYITGGGFSSNGATVGAGGLYIGPVEGHMGGPTALISEMSFYNNTALNLVPDAYNVGGMVIDASMCIGIASSIFDSNTGQSTINGFGALAVTGPVSSPDLCYQIAETTLPSAFKLQPPLFDPLSQTPATAAHCAFFPPAWTSEVQHL